MELKANKRPENASLAWYVDSLQAEGRYSFCKEEALEKMRLSAEALKKAVARLVSKNRIAIPKRGYYVVVLLTCYEIFDNFSRTIKQERACAHGNEIYG